jgi:hypothetical protein
MMSMKTCSFTCWLKLYLRVHDTEIARFFSLKPPLIAAAGTSA